MAYIDVIDECKRYQTGDTTIMANDHVTFGVEKGELAIARAVAKNPKILLCDEPTGALDYNTGKQILQILQDMSRKRGATVIIVTHNSAIAPIADRVIHMHDGRVTSIERNLAPQAIADIEW